MRTEAENNLLEAIFNEMQELKKSIQAIKAKDALVVQSFPSC